MAPTYEFVDDLVELWEGVPPVIPEPVKPAIKTGGGGGEVEGVPDGPVDIEGELTALAEAVTTSPGGVANLWGCRLAGAMLNDGVPYADIAKRIAAAVLQMAHKNGATDWTPEVEIEIVRDRYLKSFLKERCVKYDPAGGEIPLWVDAGLVDQWEATLKKGQRPEVVLNGSGWTVRSHIVIDRAEPAAEAPKEEAKGGAAPPPWWMEGSWADGEPPPPTPDWFVRNIIIKGTVGAIAGQSGVHKTFVAVNLSKEAFAKGTFAGQPVEQQCGTLFIALEDQPHLPTKFKGAKSDMGADDEVWPFRMITKVRFKLLDKGNTDPRAAKDLKEVIRAVDADFKARFGTPLGLVVIDSLQKIAGFKNADDAVECEKAYETLLAVARECGVVILVVDHHGKSDEAGMRGSSAKKDNCYFVLSLKKSSSGSALTATKIRGAPDGWAISFSTRSVPVGVDSKGQPVKTLVVDWGQRDDNPPEDTAPNGNRLLTPQRRLLEAMREVALSERVRVPGDPLAHGVKQRTVREKFYSMVEPEGEGDPAQARKKAFKRARTALLNLKLIGAWFPPGEELSSAEVEEGSVLWLVE